MTHNLGPCVFGTMVWDQRLGLWVFDHRLGPCGCCGCLGLWVFGTHRSGPGVWDHGCLGPAVWDHGCSGPAVWDHRVWDLGPGVGDQLAGNTIWDHGWGVWDQLFGTMRVLDRLFGIVFGTTTMGVWDHCLGMGVLDHRCLKPAPWALNRCAQISTLH